MGHIWLIGMMGSGKTTVGGLVAQLVNRPFVDTDAMVESSSGKTIPELFGESEKTFRAAEAEAIATASEGIDAVIASGGGSVLAQSNVTLMQESGTVVLLNVDAHTIVGRVDIGEDRPLLQSASAVEHILSERADTYESAAQQVVDTVGRTPQEIAMEVAACVDM